MRLTAGYSIGVLVLTGALAGCGGGSDDSPSAKDTTAPTLTITQPASGTLIDSTNEATLATAGTCSENGVPVTITLNGAAAPETAACSSGAWSTSLNLTAVSAASIEVVVKQTDAAGNSGTASVTLSRGQVTVSANQTIGGYPHQIDYYAPTDPTVAVVFLHGGGGKKEGMANSLGIKTNTSTADYAVTSEGAAWLTRERVLAVFPQGQTLAGYNGFTWSNYVMTSGQDDVAFLQSLVAAIAANTAFPNIDKFYIVGHSNGGMMANRMWCESPSTFDAYVSFAGPASVHLDPASTPSATEHPCAPSVVQPYLGILGDSDTVLQTTGNMASATWTVTPVLRVGDPPTWVDDDPMLINEQLFHAKRAAMKCAATPAPATTSGQITRYSDCDGSVQFQLVMQATVNGSPSGGDHCLATLTTPCQTTLRGATDLDYKQAAIDFLKQF